MGLMRDLFHFGRETVAGAVGHVLVEGTKEGGKAVVAKAIEKTFTELRSELLSFLRKLELDHKDEGGDIAARRLRERQQRRQRCEQRTYPSGTPGAPYVPGDENKMVRLLTNLYASLDESDEERKLRVEVFKWLGNLEDQEFDQELEFLEQDTVKQFLRRIGWVARGAYRKVLEHLPERATVAANYDVADRAVARQLRSFNQWLGIKKGFRP